MKKTIIYTAVGLAAVLSIALLMFAGKAAKVVDRVTDSNNIVESQKAFEEMFESIKGQQAKSNDYHAIHAADPSAGNLQIFTASKSKLRQLVADYNAKARSMENERWRSSDTPASIEILDFKDGHTELSLHQ